MFIHNTTPYTINIENKIELGDSFYLYFGRETCPWCQKLLPFLNSASNKTGVTIYYLDTEKTPYSKKLQSFREKYSVDNVPAIVKFTDKSYNKLEFNITSESFDEDDLVSILQ